MADSKKYSRVPSEYQELTNIANSGTQYIDTGLKGSDLVDCELEIVMRNDTGITTSYNFNGTYLSGSTAQFGLVATSSSECRSSINFGFADAISTTGLSLYEFHTLYATNGLQKVDNTVVGTSNFGTLNDGNFLLFARTDPNQTSGVNICPAMGLKSFTVKRNNQYIRNMIPVRRKSDSQLGLYDLANDVFYTNQGTGSFMAGSEVNYWQHSLRKLATAIDTLTTIPADIYADGNNATVGISGNTVQSGTPTPSNPVEVQGVGVRTGNLFDGLLIGGFFSGADFTISGNVDVYKSIKVFLPAGTYSFSWDKNVNVVRTIIDGVYSQPTYNNISSYTFTSTTDGYVGISFRDTTSSSTVWDVTTPIMLNLGSTALPYEPYGIKSPISSANTTTPVYLGEVETTRKISKYELTGAENSLRLYTNNAGKIGFNIEKLDMLSNSRTNGFCTHFAPTQSITWVGGDNVCFGANNAIIYFIFSDVIATQYNITDLTSIKAYLAQQYAAGTPVTMWYVLAEPETGIVNEPLMRIGNYADTVNNITIPVTAGGDTLSVDTTVQPSEVSLSYTGWHDATVKEWDGSQWD